MDGATTDLFVFQTDPLIEGVIRLAAAAADGVGGVTVVTAVDIENLSVSEASIIVVDLAGSSDLSIVAVILERSPLARLVVLSDRDDGSFVLEAMRRGVSAFVRKPDGLHGLAETLTHVAAGERVVPPELERSALNELRRFARQAHAASAVETPITDREREILELPRKGSPRTRSAGGSASRPGRWRRTSRSSIASLASRPGSRRSLAPRRSG